MSSGTRKLLVKNISSVLLNDRQRYRAFYSNSQKKLFTDDPVNNIAAPRTDALKFTKQVRFTPDRVFRPRIGEELFIIPLPLASFESLAVRDGPNHWRPPRLFRERKNSKYSTNSSSSSSVVGPKRAAKR